MFDKYASGYQNYAKSSVVTKQSQMYPSTSPASGAAAPIKRERLVHEKPIPLRMPAEELAETRQLAADENRSASNFALVVFRLGIAEFKRQKGGMQ